MLSLQVVVMHAYTNESNEAIEAKYVFPLDEMAVVCGFEAFINGKHIIGMSLSIMHLQLITIAKFNVQNNLVIK